jgi:uncharacterized protein DUF4956
MNELMSKIGRLLRDPGMQVDTVGFIFGLLASFVVALAISALYQIFYENRATGSQVHRAFPLLGPAITAIFIAIQFSLPLSLGLLGALSIIRFRTPIKEPEECAFLMLLISSAVICATFQFLLLFVLLVIATGALLLQTLLPRLTGGGGHDGVLLLTLQGNAGDATKLTIRRDIEQLLKNSKLESVSYTEHLTSMYFSFRGLRKEASLDSLHSELRKVAPVEKLNVVFNARGALS